MHACMLPNFLIRILPFRLTAINIIILVPLDEALTATLRPRNGLEVVVVVAASPVCLTFEPSEVLALDVPFLLSFPL